MQILKQMFAAPGGVFLLLSIAAALEVLGDSFFQSAMHRSSGTTRAVAFVEGAAALALYGIVVNAPRWDFGKLLGVYVVFFFLWAQVIAKIRFNQPITLPVVVGGFFIATGGAIISFWKN